MDSEFVNYLDKRNQYWHSLYASRVEHQNSDSKDSYPQWMETKYGLRMGVDNNGNYTAFYDVSDPKKFMLYQIKYFR